MNYEQPTEAHARKLLALLDYGLVKGQGVQEPGKMCIEAAVCAVFGLPHGDNPPCVGKTFRDIKVGLNDKNWSSPMARAKGLRAFGIAQLGSVEVDQQFAKDRFWLLCGQQLAPLIFRYYATKTTRNEALLEQADKMERVVTLEEVKKTQRQYAYDYAYDYAYGYGYGYAYDYAYDYAYGYGYGYGIDTWLTKVATIGVQVCKELNTLGCQWLHLAEEMK